MITTVAVPTYEEGTFTPSFTFETPGDLSCNYDPAEGHYRAGFWTRVGRLVHIDISMNFVATHSTASGQARITGMPFALLTDPSSSGFLVRDNGDAFIYPSGCSMILAQSQQDVIGIVATGSGKAAVQVTAANHQSGVLHKLRISGWGRVA